MQVHPICALFRKPNAVGVSQAHKAFKEKHISAIIAGVLTGLAYLHGSGVIHCDIKGHNILLAADATVKLADFGILFPPPPPSPPPHIHTHI